jgi:hypothetical protein
VNVAVASTIAPVWPDRASVSMRGCGSTSIIVVIGFLDLGLGGRSCGD